MNVIGFPVRQNQKSVRQKTRKYCNSTITIRFPGGERMTVRLPHHDKEKAKEIAAQMGMTLNAWFIFAITDNLRRQGLW